VLSWLLPEHRKTTKDMSGYLAYGLGFEPKTHKI
jgi:hypothetical protein